MAELVDAGLARAIGLSNYDLTDVERCHQQRPVDVIQDGLSLIDHLENRELIARCGDLGIGVIVYEPLASGVLSGRPMERLRRILDALTRQLATSPTGIPAHAGR